MAKKKVSFKFHPHTTLPYISYNPRSSAGGESAGDLEVLCCNMNKFELSNCGKCPQCPYQINLIMPHNFVDRAERANAEKVLNRYLGS